MAEGVEKLEQHLFLRRHGCDMLQGFLFSKPLPEEEFADLLDQALPAVASPNAA